MVRAVLLERAQRWRASRSGKRTAGIRPLGPRFGVTKDDDGDEDDHAIDKGGANGAGAEEEEEENGTGLIFILRPACQGWAYVWGKAQAHTISVITGARVVEGSSAADLLSSIQTFWPEWLHVVGAGPELFKSFVLQTNGNVPITTKPTALQTRYLRVLAVPPELSGQYSVPENQVPRNDRLLDLLVELGTVQWVSFSGIDTVDTAFQMLSRGGVKHALGWDGGTDDADDDERATAFLIHFYDTLAKELRVSASPATQNPAPKEDAITDGARAVVHENHDRVGKAWASAFAAARGWEHSSHSGLRPSNDQTFVQSGAAAAPVVAISLNRSEFFVPKRSRLVISASSGFSSATKSPDTGSATLLHEGFLFSRYIDRVKAVKDLKHFLLLPSASSLAASVTWLVAETTSVTTEDRTGFLPRANDPAIFQDAVGSGSGLGLRTLLTRLRFDVALQAHFTGGVVLFDCSSIVRSGESVSESTHSLRVTEAVSNAVAIVRENRPVAAHVASDGASSAIDGTSVEASWRQGGGPCLLMLINVPSVTLGKHLVARFADTGSKMVMVPETASVLRDPAQLRQLMLTCGDEYKSQGKRVMCHCYSVPPLKRKLREALAVPTLSVERVRDDAHQVLAHPLIAGSTGVGGSELHRPPSVLALALTHALFSSAHVIDLATFFEAPSPSSAIPKNSASDELGKVATDDPLLFFTMRYALVHLAKWFRAHRALASRLYARLYVLASPGNDVSADIVQLLLPSESSVDSRAAVLSALRDLASLQLVQLSPAMSGHHHDDDDDGDDSLNVRIHPAQAAFLRHFDQQLQLQQHASGTAATYDSGDAPGVEHRTSTFVQEIIAVADGSRRTTPAAKNIVLAHGAQWLEYYLDRCDDATRQRGRKLMSSLSW